MRIAIIGPTHPYKGGIAQHTTQLAHHLQAEGHEVALISWRNQYPFFYPGVQFVPENEPELPPFQEAKRALSWKNPVGWVKWAKRLKSYDKIIFVWWVPTIQAPIYLSMLRALGKQHPETIILCHNVVQHDAGPLDKQLTSRAFRAADRVLVHTEALAELARTLTDTPVTVAAMPPHIPGNPEPEKHPKKLQHRLLFFGLVRRYKGVDNLLRALVTVPDTTLIVAGEMWGKQQQLLEELIAELNLKSRVDLRPGYVAVADMNKLFQSADVLVMPYRSGTASQTSELAFAYGVPVIATKVGNLASEIRDGVDGLLCEPEDVTGLAAAIKHFYEPGVAQTLRDNLPKQITETVWRTYIEAIVD